MQSSLPLRRSHSRASPSPLLPSSVSLRPLFAASRRSRSVPPSFQPVWVISSIYADLPGLSSITPSPSSSRTSSPRPPVEVFRLEIPPPLPTELTPELSAAYLIALGLDTSTMHPRGRAQHPSPSAHPQRGAGRAHGPSFGAHPAAPPPGTPIHQYFQHTPAAPGQPPQRNLSGQTNPSGVPGFFAHDVHNEHLIGRPRHVPGLAPGTRTRPAPPFAPQPSVPPPSTGPSQPTLPPSHAPPPPLTGPSAQQSQPAAPSSPTQ
ncbi:hypothetical protein B0H11DRAFT_2023210 [Mycena galericulata]|nr:hypothetical protein B0H11DRAFT_2023210 [Mycena galericulata]